MVVHVLSFRARSLPEKPRAGEDGDDEYVNECCRGGDLVVERVLPVLRARAERVEHGQEDWGWYAWAYHGRRRLAVDSSCLDVDDAEMSVRVSIRERGPWWRFFAERPVTGEELEALSEEVVAALRAWADGPIEVDRDGR